jgi:hypothetical protein
MIYSAYKIASHVNEKKWFEFDYLSMSGLGLIVVLYFLVNFLKKVSSDNPDIYKGDFINKAVDISD